MKEISSAVEADIPVLLWGPPGIGKTAMVKNMAKQSDAHLEVLIGSTMDPTDLGRPYMTDTGVEIAPPPWARRIHETLRAGKPSWLMLDELTCAPPSIQAALLRVVHERQVGDLSLTGCRVIGAANPPEQAADPVDLSPATLNRWMHLEIQVDSEEWISGETSGWGNPTEEGAEARALVCGWISRSPGALLNVPKEGQVVKGWPSPRSWSSVAALLTVSGLGHLKETYIRKSVEGLVGFSAASEFFAWVADQDLPSGIALLDGKATLPTRGDRVALALQSAMSVAVSKNRLEDFFRLIVSVRKDIQLVSVHRLVRAIKKTNLTIPNIPEVTSVIDLVVGAK